MKKIKYILLCLFFLGITSCSDILVFDVFVEYPFSEDDDFKYTIDMKIVIDRMDISIRKYMVDILGPIANNFSLRTFNSDLKQYWLDTSQSAWSTEIRESDVVINISIDEQGILKLEGVLDESVVDIKLTETSDVKDIMDNKQKVLGASIVSLSVNMVPTDGSDIQFIKDVEFYIKPLSDDETRDVFFEYPLTAGGALAGTEPFLIGALKESKENASSGRFDLFQTSDGKTLIDSSLKNLDFRIGVKTYFKIDDIDKMPDGFIEASAKGEFFFSFSPLK